jgi:flagellar hook-associated protein 2
MGISSPGVGSGLDVNGIVSKLMAVESLPLTALTTKATAFTAKISALGSLKSVLADLQAAANGLNSGGNFTALNGTITDPTIATATPGNGAVAGTYSLEVLQLAQAQVVNTAINPGLVNGTLNIKVGAGTAVAVAVNGTDTLAVLSARINADSTLNTQLKASVVDNRLVLESKTTGAANTITVAATAAGGGTGLAAFDTANLAVARAAQDANFKVNGIAITRTGNTVTDAVANVSLTLNKVTTSATQLNVGNDVSVVQTALTKMVAAYTAANNTIKNLGTYNLTTYQGSALAGDSALRSVQSQLRGALSAMPASLAGATVTTLSQLGVSMQKDGSMLLDAAKLQTAFTTDPTAVANAVVAYGTAMEATTKAMVNAGGLISSRIDGLNSSVKDIGNQKDALSARLATVEQRYRAEFSSLDMIMSSMTATSTFLTQQIAGWAAPSK